MKKSINQSVNERPINIYYQSINRSNFITVHCHALEQLKPWKYSALVEDNSFFENDLNQLWTHERLQRVHVFDAVASQIEALYPWAGVSNVIQAAGYSVVADI